MYKLTGEMCPMTGDNFQDFSLPGEILKNINLPGENLKDFEREAFGHYYIQYLKWV